MIVLCVLLSYLPLGTKCIALRLPIWYICQLEYKPLASEFNDFCVLSIPTSYWFTSLKKISLFCTMLLYLKSWITVITPAPGSRKLEEEKQNWHPFEYLWRIHKSKKKSSRKIWPVIFSIFWAWLLLSAPTCTVFFPFMDSWILTETSKREKKIIQFTELSYFFSSEEIRGSC